MSRPRRVLPGQTYLLTRRVFQRQFLLRPDGTVNQIFLYCLALAAERFDIQIHAYCVMSNHFHLVATDTHAQLPAFMHWLDEYVAKCVNAHRGRWESFWAPGTYSRVELLESDAMIRELAYTFVNPVEAGLVHTAKQWPGAISSPEDWKREPERIERPKVFFRENGSMPDCVMLELRPPTALAPGDVDAVDLLRKEVDEREQAIGRERAKRGLGFLGRRAVLKQSPWSYPRGREPRRNMNPRIASTDTWRRIEVLQQLKQFLLDYREAWRAFSEGDRMTVFPEGTYWMRVRLGVQCSGP